MPWQRKNRRRRLKTPDTAYDGNRPARKNDRLCIATGEHLRPDQPALKFVCAPDGAVLPDLAGKLPGRGAWVRATQGAVETAARKGLFARAFRQQAEVRQGPTGLAEMVVAGLKKRALELLGLAKKSGGIVAGFDKVRAGLKKGEFIAYIHASDAADDGREKLLNLASAQYEPCRIVDFFSGADLDQALGSMNAVHLGLKKTGTARAFLTEIDRLSGFMPEHSVAK